MRRSRCVIFRIVIRGYLAPWRSYWYDELLSVYYYGANYDTVWGAIQALAKGSIHPPLYQFILYYWIEMFGVSELATRTLSNLYVVGGTLRLYLLAYRVYEQRVALGSVIIFTMMYFQCDTVWKPAPTRKPCSCRACETGKERAGEANQVFERQEYKNRQRRCAEDEIPVVVFSTPATRNSKNAMMHGANVHVRK